jgi:CRISPR system Cascade subunit CasB
MNQPPDYVLRFVAHLRRLADNDDPAGRAALAKLRRGLGKPPGAALETLAVVQPHLPPGLRPEAESACYLAASLFAEHPQPGGGGSLGRAFALLAQRRQAESLEKRFVALLNADEEDLPEHLRHAVSLLKSEGVAVDWACLIDDLQRWDHPARFVQRQWAWDFWAGEGREEPEPAESAEPTIAERK